MFVKTCFADAFSGNGNVITLVAKATVPKLNCLQRLNNSR